MRIGLYMRSASDYLRRMEFRGLTRKAIRLAHSDHPGIVVRKDLTIEPQAPRRSDRPTIRPATSTDILSLTGSDREADRDPDDLWERRLRRHIHELLGPEGCYVAEDADAGPGFMQYLFTAADNDRLQAAFPGLFPVLATDEALVEFLYVSHGSRSPGPAVDGIRQVADEARQRGADSVISFIDQDNRGALFVNHLAGFTADGIRWSRRRFFRKSYVFEPWPDDVSKSLLDIASRRAAIA